MYKTVSSNTLMEGLVETLLIFECGRRLRSGRGGRGCGRQRGVARIVVVRENEEGLCEVVGGIVGCRAVVIEIIGLWLITAHYRGDFVIHFNWSCTYIARVEDRKRGWGIYVGGYNVAPMQCIVY